MTTNSIITVFNTYDIRRQIFKHKEYNRNIKVNNIREKLILRYKNFCEKNPIINTVYNHYYKPLNEYDLFYPESRSEFTKAHIYIHNYALEKTYNWRETAIVLGLYYMIE